MQAVKQDVTPPPQGQLSVVPRPPARRVRTGLFWQLVSNRKAAVGLGIRTADPVPAWIPSTVTMVGDAIHTMTPGRGAGANTALRDARELRDRVVRVRDGELGLLEAVGGYEELMRTYAALAVRESLEFMHDNRTARRPVIGPVSVFAQRSGLRLVNRLPAVKRRMARSMQRVRDSELV